RALLAQAGYPKGFSVPFTYLTNFSHDGISFDALAIKIINDLKVVGITAIPRAEVPSVAIPEYHTGKASLVLWIWGPTYPDPNDNLSLFGPGATVATWSHYLHDDGLAGLIAQGVVTSNTAARASIYKQVQERLLKTGPYAVLVQPEYPVGLRSNIKGFVYSPL